jgi:acyl-coenzyme A synthetase/AMP-(fatty) acid ligase
MNVAEIFERQARLSPAHPAVVMGTYEISYGQLLAMVFTVAQRLQEGGVTRSHRVGIMVPNPIGHIALTLALARIGAVSVGLPPALADAPLEDLAGSCEMTHLVYGTEGARSLQRIPAGRQLGFAALSAPPTGPLKPSPIAAVEPGDIWRVSLASGTTGTTKGIERSHLSSLVTASLPRSSYPEGASERTLLAMDVAMTFAVHNWLRAFSLGWTVVLPTSPAPEAVLRALHEQGVTQAFTTTGTAMAIGRMAGLPGSAYALPPPSLRMFCLAGAAISPQIFEGLRTRICPQICIIYGSTEAGISSFADSALLEKGTDCAGRVVPWIEAQAVDAHCAPVPLGTRGRLRFRGAGLSAGYCKAHVVPGEGFQDAGWFLSNDTGMVTPHGLIYLSGRDDDVLNIGGVKVEPQRIEVVILQDAAISECAVVLGADEAGAPLLVAVVVASGDVDARALSQRCESVLGANCAPRAVVKVPSLPRDAIGQIARKTLQSQLRPGRKEG